MSAKPANDSQTFDVFSLYLNTIPILVSIDFYYFVSDIRFNDGKN